MTEKRAGRAGSAQATKRLATVREPAAHPALRILLVGTQMALGGAQRLLLDQATWFDRRGHDVTAAFLYDKEGLTEIWARDARFPMLTLSSIGSSTSVARKFLGLIAGLFRLWRLLRRGEYDIIETFTYDSNLLALPPAWLAGVPVRIATHHGIIEGFPRVAERMHAAIVNVGVASVLVNVSRKVLEQAAAIGIRREHMTVIPNGIGPVVLNRATMPDIRREIGVGPEDVFILSVGRLVYQKGHEYLIEAIGILVSALPRIQVAICGEGPLRRQLEAQIRRLGLDASVRLLGNRMDIDHYLASADIFALPSRWEGLPVALLEAMQHGLPVVATAVEGVEEVVQDDVQGLLVPAEDSRALAEALRLLVIDPGRRAQMGGAASARIRQAYTIDIMCGKYLALMNTLLAKTDRR